jgi:hypothetical protein
MERFSFATLCAIRAVVLASAIWCEGCGGEKEPPPPPPTGGGSGAFGVVTVNGLQKLYLPLPVSPAGKSNNQLAIVDVGVAGAGVAGSPALLGYVDLGSASDVATTTGGTSKIVVAASTSSPKVWLIDPTTDQVTSTIVLDDSYGTSSFSGGGGYVTGIAMDGDDRAILSVWNGFAILDIRTKAITSIAAAPSENFGFDPVRRRIIAPFYDCVGASGAGTAPPCDSYHTATGAPIDEGLNVIDLNDTPPTVYTYQLPGAASPLIPEAPVGGEPDSAAIDHDLGVAVIPSESADFHNVIDLGAAVFDKAAGTVTGSAASHHEVAYTGRSEGVSIDSVSHLAFFEGESSSDVGVMDLVQAKAGAGMFLHATMPDKPHDGGSWSNLFDPHGIAVTTGILDGSPVGFVVDVSVSDQAWVARIDLKKFLAVRPALPGDASAAEIAGAVTFLDASTAR